MSAGNWKAMFKAIQEGDIGLVTYYLQVGVDPNYQHPEFNALPLVESIRFNHLDVTRLLLEKGADPTNKEFWGGETAWSLAEAKENIAALTILQSFSGEG